MPCLADERGFSLVELLVIVMVIGVLAAIALPAFLGQSDKAAAAEAKSAARTGATAAQILALEFDHRGNRNITNDLKAIEPSLADAYRFRAQMRPGGAFFSEARSRKTGVRYRISRDWPGWGQTGISYRLCDRPGVGGCGTTRGPRNWGVW